MKQLKQELITQKVVLGSETDIIKPEDCKFASRGVLMIELTWSQACSSTTGTPDYSVSHYPLWIPLRVVAEKHSGVLWQAHILSLDPATIPFLLLVRSVTARGISQLYPVIGILPFRSAHFLRMKEPEFGPNLVVHGKFGSLRPTCTDPFHWILFRHIVFLSSHCGRDRDKLLLIASGVVDALLPDCLLLAVATITKSVLKHAEQNFLVDKVLTAISLFLVGLDPSMKYIGPFLDSLYDEIIHTFGDEATYHEQLIPYAHSRWNLEFLLHSSQLQNEKQQRLELKMSRLSSPVPSLNVVRSLLFPKN